MQASWCSCYMTHGKDPAEVVPMMLQPEEGRAIQDLGGTTLFPAQQASRVVFAQLALMLAFKLQLQLCL